MNPCYSARRPAPPPPPPPLPTPPQEIGCGFLLQRILASGRLCRRPRYLTLCPDQFPCGAQPPFIVLEAGVVGRPQWQEIPCCRRGGLMLLVNVTVSLRLRDSCGACFTAEATAEEELLLRCRCPQSECWRGQIAVQAAARPWRCRPCGCREEDRVPVELLIEGYLLSPCAVGGPDRPCCPDPRPLYPEAPCCWE